MHLFLILYYFLPATTLTGRAVKIIDGDTFDLLSNGTVYRIRLNGIDCPERGQPYYQQAQQALGRACANAVLTVKYNSKDRNGRLLGDVYVNGMYINRWLVQEGYAWHFKKYSSDQQLATAERRARAARLGLWKEARAIPPWEWRKKRGRSGRTANASHTCIPFFVSQRMATSDCCSFLITNRQKTSLQYHILMWCT